MLILDNKYHWQICERGHSMLHEPGQPHDVCVGCGSDIVLNGVIDENLPHADKQWRKYFSMAKKIGQDWKIIQDWIGENNKEITSKSVDSAT